MTDNRYKCENCSAALTAANTVCQHCDAGLSISDRDPRVGKYKCPACNTRFDKTAANLWPVRIKWYMPQAYKPQCPHCHTFLRDIQLSRSSLHCICMSMFAPERQKPRLPVRKNVMTSTALSEHLMKPQSWMTYSSAELMPDSFIPDSSFISACDMTCLH